MALIVEYHVIADMYPVGDTSISAGMLVELNAAGNVIPTDGNQSEQCLGVAGDSRLDAEGQTTKYSDDVHIGSDGGGTRWTQNRVSDFYNEALASQKITVYNGGGKFWISDDLLVAGDGAATNQAYASAADGEWADDGNTTLNSVAVGVGAAQAYGSGVPGTDVDGHISLGDYFPVLLRI